MLNCVWQLPWYQYHWCLADWSLLESARHGLWANVSLWYPQNMGLPYFGQNVTERCHRITSLTCSVSEMSVRVHTAQATPWSITGQSVLVEVRAWNELAPSYMLLHSECLYTRVSSLQICVFVQQNLYKRVVDIHLPYVPVCTSSMWVRTAVASVRFSVWTWMVLWISGWFMFHVGMDCNTIIWIFDMNLDLWICNWSKFHVRMTCGWFCPLHSIFAIWVWNWFKFHVRMACDWFLSIGCSMWPWICESMTGSGSSSIWVLTSVLSVDTEVTYCA